MVRESLVQELLLSRNLREAPLTSGSPDNTIINWGGTAKLSLTRRPGPQRLGTGENSLLLGKYSLSGRFCCQVGPIPLCD